MFKLQHIYTYIYMLMSSKANASPRGIKRQAYLNQYK